MLLCIRRGGRRRTHLPLEVIRLGWEKRARCSIVCLCGKTLSPLKKYLNPSTSFQKPTAVNAEGKCTSKVLVVRKSHGSHNGHSQAHRDRQVEPTSCLWEAHRYFRKDPRSHKWLTLSSPQDVSIADGNPLSLGWRQDMEKREEKEVII